MDSIKINTGDWLYKPSSSTSIQNTDIYYTNNTSAYYNIAEQPKAGNFVIVSPINDPKYDYVFETNVPMEIGAKYKIICKDKVYDDVFLVKRNEKIIFNSTPEDKITNVIRIAAPPRPDDGIKKVIFNEEKLTTVVLWKDGTKTKIKCDEFYDDFDKEKALALCFMKKHFDNRGCFNEVLKKYCE